MSRIFIEDGNKLYLRVIAVNEKSCDILFFSRILTTAAISGRLSRTMAYKIAVQEGDRLLFSEILDALGQTQSAIAKAAIVKPPWLSQVLKGQRKKVDGDMLERVANVLVDGLKSIEGNSRFPKERVQVVLASLSRFTAAAAAEVAPKVYPPGGLVAVDAAHYIKRAFDEDALKVFQGTMPFTMLVRGPVQSGKSSLLARLQNKAGAIGFKTAWFDPKGLSSQPEIATDKIEVNAIAAASVAKLLEEQWGLTPPDEVAIESIEGLLNWLLRALAPTASTPRLLILDDVAALGAHAAEDWLSLFVRTMHNKRATGGPQVSLAVGFSHHFETGFSRKTLVLSSVVHWWPRIELDWLTEAEVRTLEKGITGSSTLDDLYDLFGGQPYLTHAALAHGEFLHTVRTWTRVPSNDNAGAIRRLQPYRRHKSAIRHAIVGRARATDAEIQEVLKAFADACSGKVIRIPDHESFLETSKLIKIVNKRGKKSIAPALNIYRLIADDLSATPGK
jgi:transcriptional regulator with XRE-family HTH domain